MAKTDVAVAKPKSDQLPAYLQGGKFANEDNFDSSDVIIPRIKLIQAMSQEATDFEAAKPGVFWHTGMDIPLGTEFDFIVADRRKKYLLTAPLEDGQGVLARADDAKTWDRTGSWQVKIRGVKQPVTWKIENTDVLESGLAKWGTSNPADEDSGPAATMFYDYLVFLPAHLDLGPAVISLARSQIRKAKKGLNDKIQLHKTNGRPMQALVFNASSVDDQSDAGPFKNWLFKSAGFNQSEELFNLAMEHRGALANVKIADEADTGEKSEPVDDGEGKF